MSTTPLDGLRAAWLRHIDGDTRSFDRLVTRHRERHRHYHTLAHVDAVVRWVEDLATAEDVADLAAVVAAAFYHDAIYEPRSPANERASARLAERELRALGWTVERATRIATMIEGTARHLAPGDIDTAVLFDADLAVLASDPDHYRSYVSAIRAEYRHVTDEAWAVGRADVLRTFVDRDAIYASLTGRQEWESRARSNLAAELDSLGP